MSVGMLILGIAEPQQGSLFIISGLFLGAGGSLTLLNSFPLGFIVDTELIPLILTSVNCLFDASAVTFLLCYLVYHHLRATRAQIFITLAVIAAISYSFLALMWRRYEPDLQRHKLLVTSPPDQDLDGGLELSPVETTSGTDLQLMGSDLPPSECLRTHTEETLATPFDKAYSTQWTSQLPSRKFLFITAFASICILRANSYFGIVKEVLVRLGDDETGHLYTQLFVASLPLGFLFIPLINYFLVTYGFLITFRVIYVLGMLYGGFVLVPDLESQVVTFVAFTAFRAFLYSVIATYFARMFGPVNAGRLYGSMSVVASGVNFLQYPAFLLLGSSMFYYNLGLLVLALPAAILVERILAPILVQHPEADVKQVKND